MNSHLTHISCFIFDLDGTIYCGDNLFDGVHDVFSLLKKNNKQFVFVTNNSSKSGETYVSKLKNMGLTWVERTHIITSGDILINYARSKQFKKIVIVGSNDFRKQCTQSGFTEIIEKHKPVDAIFVAFDTNLTYEKLDLATHYARKGVPLLATNEDIVCPMPHNEYIPDCGSITALIELASAKKATYFGNPQLPAITYISNYLNIAPNQLCMVGDRLYTDMKMGQHGLTTILVLSGETNRSMLENSTLQPTIVCNGIQDICAML